MLNQGGKDRAVVKAQPLPKNIAELVAKLLGPAGMVSSNDLPASATGAHPAQASTATESASAATSADSNASMVQTVPNKRGREDLPAAPQSPVIEGGSTEPQSEDAQRKQLLELMASFGMDSKTIAVEKTAKLAQAAPPVAATEVQRTKQRLQLTTQQHSLAKKRAEALTQLAALQADLTAQTEAIVALDAQQADCKRALEMLDAVPKSPDTGASAPQQQAPPQDSMVKTAAVEEVVASLVTGMVADDWEVSAANHTNEYVAYQTAQTAASLPVMPLGKWYVITHLLTSLQAGLQGTLNSEGQQASGKDPAAEPVARKHKSDEDLEEEF